MDAASATHRPASNGIFLVYIFLITLAFPTDAAFYIGSIKLPPYRAFLIVALLFCFFKVVSSPKFRINIPDVFMLLFVIWSVLSLINAHGVNEIWQYCALLIVETVSPYFIARCYITSSYEFVKFAKVHFLIVLFIIPFAIVETLTGNYILKAFGETIFGGHASVVISTQRLGLSRALGPFEHPIHYGIFCAAILGILLTMGKTISARIFQMGTIFVSTFCSLSTGPLVVFLVQTLLLSWDKVTGTFRSKWKILIFIFAALYLVIDIASNRTPFHVFVTYLTFRLASSYNRILIWEIGSASVWKHPLFGIGLGEWERPYWMGSSIDNFWLLIAIRYGLPALIFLTAAMLVISARLANLDLSESDAKYRKGWFVSFTALVVAGATVHYWNALYCLFMFFLGSSAWLFSSDNKKAQTPRRTEMGRRSIHRDGDAAS